MENELRNSWDKILEHMRTEFLISDVSFRTFIKKLSVYNIQDNILTILIDDTGIGNSKSFIEQKYSSFLSVSIEEITNIHFEQLKFIALSELDTRANNQDMHSVKPQKRHPSINPQYTFDTFIVGDNNDFAHAASLKVAEEPGESINPLYIYGGPGLGKTHLMHAIANYILDHDSSKRVVYVTSETFTNEIVNALRGSKNEHSQSLEEFREKYRENVDVLLIDDIQFIIGKESTQQEFFFTFSYLTDSKKQVIITSDKHPSNMTMLDERYRSRFEMGITVDIKAPTYETRMAILRSKVEIEHIQIDDSILDYIASNIISNIRELQGAINQVISFSRLCGREITMELTKEALSDKINPNMRRPITIDYILETVADHFDISVKDILSNKRSSNIAYPRHICMYLCRTLTSSPLAEIGNKLGNRHHSTVLHSCEFIENKINEKEEETMKHIDVLKKKIDPE
ncbi:MAG: chromosomal replication initiator protein DnaA [Clostridiaceae bacterium]|nr:chromosomal replication initiator protein DnaA [Clostridiaceae bacterium]